MIYTFEVGNVIPTNAYFYIDEKTNAGFLIDAGAESEKILNFISEKKLTIEKILITHGHYDHIGAAAAIQKKFNIPICMQKNGKNYAENPAWNISIAFGESMTLQNVTYLDDYSEIILNANPNFKLKIIPCAGHTLDGAIYYSENDGVAFVGDSIFKGSFGRTDLPGGDFDTLIKNIKEKILTLPDETILLSGHSPETTVAAEMARWLDG
jgi:glyoxylase-like metal-dependent hydrolase (beta-lactamase superfamily II)